MSGCKVAELICICVVCIGTKAKKALKFNVKTMVIYPVLAGLTLVGMCFIFHGMNIGMSWFGFPANRILYALCSVAGTMLVHQGLDGIAKYYNYKVGEDRFNFENESFQQSEDLVANDYSVNIPMIYYWKQKMHKGWINIINPFRGTIVLGTPGSGKSFGIIDPFIRQHAAKGFSMMVYDFKFPTLAKTLFYQYCKNMKLKKLPENCGFRIVNFTDVEYSNRINPIQRKYIPDLSAASETAATLLASLNKGGGEKKGGSEAFFTNSAENFLAAIIYFFVNFHPVGFKNGKKLKRYISLAKEPEENKEENAFNQSNVQQPVDAFKEQSESQQQSESEEQTMSKEQTNSKEELPEGNKFELVIRNWDDYQAIDAKNNVILDFVDENGNDVSTDEDRMFVDLNGFSYKDRTGKLVKIERCWYEDENGQEVEPDTITGEYSDMPHVLSFLGRPYDQVFNILMQDDKIASLMVPFKSAYDNKANDQLEGMVGTLRVNAARLVSPEAYWVFTGDDFDLKISDKANPSYLVIANDPEKEQVIGSLNALVLNRLITRVNSKGNIPVSIIVDELPTLYFHKIDRLIGTARSNKVAVTLGFQELPQLEADYGKVGMQKIITTCGNIFMGAARNKETLEWAQNDVFGKAKQTSRAISINDNKVSTTISEKMDYLVPAAKIADMATGWLAGQAARDFTATDERMLNHFDIEQSEEFKTTKYFCKTHFDMKKIKDEEEHYVPLPKIYEFKNDREKEIMLNRNFKRVNDEVEKMVKELLGMA
ncbi:type IV secretory system conjugative DNA transfer family protein [Bacteroides caccae]|uniref:type IV secretory system conjugative DNA transfer family protein n=1 Tax=Bacteroides caccae TaxID=47678 RepID=UPI00286F2992|nr:type IV secretory system conjugative DNA transfer family protein [Bacteroides caccae]